MARTALEAYQDDEIPYIESLGDSWGELCAVEKVASSWAIVWLRPYGWHGARTRAARILQGTTNCLSALVAAKRHDDVLALLDLAPYKMWHYRRYGVMALSAMGKKTEAIRYAEEGRGLNDSPVAIARTCERSSCRPDSSTKPTSATDRSQPGRYLCRMVSARSRRSTRGRGLRKSWPTS